MACKKQAVQNKFCVQLQSLSHKSYSSSLVAQAILADLVQIRIWRLTNLWPKLERDKLKIALFYSMQLEILPSLKQISIMPLTSISISRSIWTAGLHPSKGCSWVMPGSLTLSALQTMGIRRKARVMWSVTTTKSIIRVTHSMSSLSKLTLPWSTHREKSSLTCSPSCSTSCHRNQWHLNLHYLSLLLQAGSKLAY